MKTVGDLRTLYERIRRDGEAGEILCERIASGLIEA